MPLNKFLSSTALIWFFAAPLLIAEGTDQPTSPDSTALVPLPKFIIEQKGRADGSLTSPAAQISAEGEKGIPGGFTLKKTDLLGEGRASNFQDLLRGAPGVFLQSESEAEVTKISIRGSGILSEDEPQGVQFLLDGLTLNQADGEVILEDFDLSTIKYAEIYRGANASRYGSLTLGGAINLVSTTGYEADPLKVRVEGGSYGYWRGQVTAAGVAGPFDYVGSLMTRTRDGFREHSHETLDRLTTSVGYRLKDNLENRFYLTLDRADRALPGGLTKEAMKENPHQAADDAVAEDFNKKFDLVRIADKITQSTDRQLVEAGIFWFHRNLEDRGFFSPEFRQGITRLHSDNYGAMANSVTTEEVFQRRNIFTLGLNAALEIEYSKNFENLLGIRGSMTGEGSSTSLNIPLHLENQHYLTDNLSVVTGAQVIYARRTFVDHFLTDEQGDQSHQQVFYGLNPKLGIVYMTSEAGQLFLNFSRSWQPPSFDNLIQFADGANSSVVYKPLQPQRSWTLEVGTRGERGPWEWECSLYQSTVRNELLELNDAQGQDIGAVNVARSSHRGVEAGLEIEFLELWGLTRSGPGTKTRLTLSQSYTLNDFHFRKDPVYGANRIGGIPLQVYEADLLYQAASGFYAGPNLQYIPFHYAVDQANRLFADPYSLLGFKVGFTQAKKFSVFLEVKNLANKRYASSIDPIAAAEPGLNPEIFHPGEGRAVYSGVSWTW